MALPGPRLVMSLELIRHFTLTDADEGFVRKFRTGRNVLGAAVQLCALPWLGYVPDDVTAPAAAVGRWWGYLAFLTQTERARRNPRSSIWRVGWLRRRTEARQLQDSSNQPPPRSTR